MENLMTFEEYDYDMSQLKFTPSTIDDLLIKCIKNGDKEGAIDLIDKGANVNLAYSQARKNGQNDLAQYFYDEYGADPNYYYEDETNEKASSGLTKNKKSEIVKRARRGKDIGKKGKNFKEVAASAEKKYGSKEKGEKVAAAAMWKNINK